MQLVTDAFDFGYFSNGHCKYYGAPALAEKLHSPLGDKQPSDYRSRHGATSLPYEPSECPNWWYRFFRRHPAFVPVEEVDPARMRKMRRSLAALVNAFDRPVLIKNLFASVRLGPIIRYLPESRFIVISRDELDNARSLLAGRRELGGSYEAWWSVEPPDSGSLRALPPHSQVVEQIRGIHAQIDCDLNRFGVPESRVHRIRYESLCEDTDRCITNCEAFFARNSIHVNRLFTTPSSFECRATSSIKPEVDTALADYVGDVEKT
jgi:hypothetical protein